MSVDTQQTPQQLFNTQRAEQLVKEAARFIFDEYDPDKDGLLQRKEFFAFLWKLKSESGYQLNEGQMIACWDAMDEGGKGAVNFEQFSSGLEVIYDHFFFAVENGAPVPESRFKFPENFGETNDNYNTIRFKNSAAVHLFESILQEEQQQKQQEQDKLRKRAEQVAEGSASRSQRVRDSRGLPEPSRSLQADTFSKPAEVTFTRSAPPSSHADKGATLVPRIKTSAESSTAATPTDSTRRSSAGDEMTFNAMPRLSGTDSPTTSSPLSSSADVGRAPSWRGGAVSGATGLSRPGFNAISRSASMQKKEEAENKVQAILAERHRAERLKREQERAERAELERRRSSAEADALLAEPAWKRQTKSARAIV